MIRVGLSGSRNFVLMFMSSKWPKEQVYLTEDEAADLFAQIKSFLPKEKQDAEVFSADVLRDI